jgi:hypothetical protein
MKCDMHNDCPHAVTHIGDKGFVYCATHAPCRAGYERTRRMRKWEIAALKAGQAISYTPKSREQHLQDRAYTGLDPKFNAALAAVTRSGK